MPDYTVPTPRVLSWITNEDLYKHANDVVERAQDAITEGTDQFGSNVVDPFSAVFDSIISGISLEDWRQEEIKRQTQKTLQNAVGDFHQNILGSCNGWESLPAGGFIDLVNVSEGIVAEVKNKYNTLTGTHVPGMYDRLKEAIEVLHPGFTSYYVHIIPRTATPYDRVFAPSGRPENDRIRQIDGRSFYSLVSGNVEALDQLYMALPDVCGNILGTSPRRVRDSQTLIDLFIDAYGGLADEHE
jgi:hypothetical protein